jgi:hypothetical protein
MTTTASDYLVQRFDDWGVRKGYDYCLVRQALHELYFRW